MLRSELDHLVVTCRRLETGVAFVERALGVSMSPGGKHDRMGTHNALLRIGAQSYLEVIAVDPDAQPLAHARWFELDGLSEIACPSLATWVVRTSSILEASQAVDHRFGEIQPMSRGALDWQISIPRGGKFVDDGVLPSLIQWGSDMHPANRLPDCGIRLQKLTFTHPQTAAVSATLQQIGFVDSGSIVDFQTAEIPQITATFETAAGTRRVPATF
jgi:hypothetical protein